MNISFISIIIWMKFRSTLIFFPSDCENRIKFGIKFEPHSIHIRKVNRAYIAEVPLGIEIFY